MATLEKIRSKSVLLIIIIGVALLAFIVGDALTNSQNLFGDRTTVAKIGNDKIDYTEYQRKREELNNRLEEARKQNPQQYANFDTQLLPQMALNELIGEKLLDNAVAKLGLKTSGEQLRFYVLEQPVNREALGHIIQQLNNSGLSVQTPQQAYEVIFNPKRNGLTDAQMEPFQKAWVAMEEETKQMLNRQTYQRLVYGSVKANDLDKKALYDDFVATTQADVAYLPFGMLDEKKYPVSDAEMKTQYDLKKNQFKVEEPTKDIAFIAVSITPSDADKKAADKLAQETLASMRDSAGVNKQLRKEGVQVERRQLRASDIPAGAIKDYVLSASMDSAKMIYSNIQGFTAVKVNGRTAAVDSIQLDIVQVAGANLPARVLAKLNTGLSTDSINTVFSADSVMAQTKQWIPLYSAQGPTQALQDAQLDSLMNAGSSFITIMSSPEGSVLAKVVEKKAPVQIYEYDEVTYSLKPSVKTINDERTKLEKFLNSNKTAKDFIANAAKAGYSVQEFSLNQSSPAVPRMMGMNSYFPDSRQVVRWVMIDGETGEVSHIYESKDSQNPMLYAAAVTAEYDDYVPMTNKDVKAYVTNLARRSKAGDEMVKKYSNAKSVADAARAMGVEAQNYPQLRLSRSSEVRDGKVLGQILGSSKGTKPVVVKGDDGVYVFVVNGHSTETFPFNDQQYEQQYYQMVNPQFEEMMRGSKKIVNKSYKFEAGD